MIPYTEIKNLDFWKDWLKNWVDSGQYFKDIQSVIRPAYDYISYVIGIDKACVIFDIDETMITEYSLMLANDFGWTESVIEEAQTITTFPAIKSTLDFFDYCNSEKIQTIILSSRREKHIKTVLELLQNSGYSNYSQLILRPDSDTGTIAEYKMNERRKLTESGYLIQCNLGDQESDFYKGYAYYDIKIPNKFYEIGLESL